uniref:SET domain-containing protein n=1 Tax=Trypanosoma congolense (strain IL3000) TaxID=1068625 RepID=G0URM4_TRYCI|nr:conserved hypothetical protein [Trypanosoma congolense IL3000]
MGEVDTTDHSVEQLNTLFTRLGVTCKVERTHDKGKHVLATASIPKQTDLFEEAPIVSWPSRGFLTLNVPFCLHCLRRKGDRVGLETGDKGLEWRSCDVCGSFFCSDSCVSTAKMSHKVLCGTLRDLREDVDGCSSEKGDRGCRSITKESLANCVAWVVGRIAESIKQRKFSGRMLEDSHRDSTNSLSRQLFHVVTASFNRFVDAPKGTEFGDIDPKCWFDDIRKLLKRPCCQTLVGAALPPVSSDASWALEIVDGLLREETLNTFLGILALNSQGLNGFVIDPPVNGDTSSHSSIEWVLKGGGIYSLQSNFNHSCQPNVAVFTECGTHDITLRTLRDVQAGEELTISYIPVENTNRAERHKMLEGYFFTCQCALCEYEKNLVDTPTA